MERRSTRSTSTPSTHSNFGLRRSRSQARRRTRYPISINASASCRTRGSGSYAFVRSIRTVGDDSALRRFAFELLFWLIRRSAPSSFAFRALFAVRHDGQWIPQGKNCRASLRIPAPAQHRLRGGIPEPLAHSRLWPRPYPKQRPLDHGSDSLSLEPIARQ